MRGEGLDHGGLGLGREGDETSTLFGPVVLDAALTRKSSGASREQQNTRERGEREKERKRGSFGIKGEGDNGNSDIKHGK